MIEIHPSQITNHDPFGVQVNISFLRGPLGWLTEQEKPRIPSKFAKRAAWYNEFIFNVSNVEFPAPRLPSPSSHPSPSTMRTLLTVHDHCWVTTPRNATTKAHDQTFCFLVVEFILRLGLTYWLSGWKKGKALFLVLSEQVTAISSCILSSTLSWKTSSSWSKNFNDHISWKVILIIFNVQIILKLRRTSQNISKNTKN